MPTRIQVITDKASEKCVNIGNFFTHNTSTHRCLLGDQQEVLFSSCYIPYTENVKELHHMSE
jgi:hypothetical protein